MATRKADDADIPAEVYDLARNDTAAAVALARKLRAEGKWNSAVAEILLQLQDDPFELLAEL